MRLTATEYRNNQKERKQWECELIQKDTEWHVVNIYPDVEYQTFHGFGGAITEAAGYAFSKLSPENRDRILSLYFTREGNNYSIVRSHIDSCDFSLSNYSAISETDGIGMETFSMERNEQYIIPLLRAAQEKRGEPLKILLSPWSPPAFMKTNGERNHGGKLKPEFRSFYAEYLCRYIKEYRKLGFHVTHITVQNEPEAVQTWDSCIFTAEEERDFVRDYLYPAMVRNELTDVKINIWDHNKERMYERAKVTIDKDTNRMISGIAFHWYTGDHFEAVAVTREAFPDKELIFTEGCVEYSRFDTNQLRNAQMYAHDIIGNLNAGMNAFLDWNIMLDENGGPNHANNFCDAPIMVDTTNDTFEVKLSFDYIGHFSRYIEKGAKRIATTRYTDKLEVTAFKNPDKSIVVVMLNRNEFDIPVNIRINGKLAEITVAANSIVTGLI